jgi:kumamolisin
MSQVRSIYQIPTPTASKYVVGVLSFGGGLYGTVDSQGVLTNGDVQAYWTSIGIAPANHPKVIVVGVNGGSNRPSMNDGSATIENTLDVETVGGACPSSNVTIILYIAPNSLNQFAPLLQYMYSTNVTVDGVNYKPNIISCSWGASEIYFSSLQLSSINSILSTMSNAGITVCAATGDYGSNNGVGGTGNYVDFPSSNPYITAVGGTTLVCPNNV